MLLNVCMDQCKQHVSVSTMYAFENAAACAMCSLQVEASQTVKSL